MQVVWLSYSPDDQKTPIGIYFLRRIAECMMHQGKYRNLPYIIVVLGLFFATAAEFYLHALSGIVTGYTHLYYLLIIILAYYFRYKAVLGGVYLGAIHSIADMYLIGFVTTDALIRSGSFVAAALLSAFLAATIVPAVPVKEVIENSMQRVQAILVSEADIVQMRKEGDVASLLGILAHGEMDQRYAAIDALGLLRDPRAIELLVESTRSDTYSGLRWKAAEALARIGKPSVGPLITLLNDPDEDVRWKVAIALGEIKDPRAIKPLINVLSDPDSYVRSRAALALGTIGDPAIPDLVKALASDDPAVRAAAASALGIIGSVDAIHPLIRALFDPVDRVKIEAAEAVAKIGDPALSALIDALKSAQHEKVSMIVVDPAVIETLIDMLDGADPALRLDLAAVLKELDDPSLSHLIEELSDANSL